MLQPIRENVLAPVESTADTADRFLRTHPESLALIPGGAMGFLGMSSGRGAIQCMKRGLYGSVIGVGLGIGFLFYVSQDENERR